MQLMDLSQKIQQLADKENNRTRRVVLVLSAKCLELVALEDARRGNYDSHWERVIKQLSGDALNWEFHKGICKILRSSYKEWKKMQKIPVRFPE